MDKIAGLLTVAMFAFILQPQISEIGIAGGPHWPETNRSYPLTRVTVGGTAYSAVGGRLGIRFGAAYKQGGDPFWCRGGPHGGFLCFQAEEEGQSLWDYIDLSMIAEARVVQYDRLDLRLMLGPTWGIPVACSEKSLTHGTEWECPANRLRTDWRLIAGAGLGFHATERVSVTMDYRYGINLRQLDYWMAEDAGVGVSAAVVAGVNYHLGR